MIFPTINRLIQVCRHLEDFDGPFYDVETNRVVDRSLPHMLFSAKERALFRNMSIWSSDWTEFPGPAELWPDDYDLIKWGWVLPASELARADDYQRAFEIAAFEVTEPDDFCLILPGGEQLVMMEKEGVATGFVQRIFALD